MTMFRTCFVACAMALCLASCGGGAADGSAIVATDPGGGTTNPPPPPPPPPPTPSPGGGATSFALIDADQAAGKLSMEQALLYKLYVDFGDSRLPTQYQGNDSGLVEGTSTEQVSAYIQQNGMGALSPSAQDTIHRFFTPPYIQGSWWNQQHPDALPLPPGTDPVRTAATTKVAATRLAVTMKAATDSSCQSWVTAANCPYLADWAYAGGTSVKVWYRTNQGAAIDDANFRQATLLALEFDQNIVPKLQAAMKGRTPLPVPGPDARLSVTLTPLANGYEGKTVGIDPAASKNSPAHVYVNSTLPNRSDGPVQPTDLTCGVKANAAHEYLHAIQFSYNTVKSGGFSKYTALADATATWAEHYVYPDCVWETNYAEEYLRRMQLSLDDAGAPPLFRYGAYLFPLFIEQEFTHAARPATFIGDLWAYTEIPGIGDDDLKVFDAVLKTLNTDFSHAWPRFVAAAWNKETLNKFERWENIPGFLKDSPQDVSSQTADLVAGRGYSRLLEDIPWTPGPGPSINEIPWQDLPHASASFVRIQLSDPTTRSFAFINALTYNSTKAPASVPPITSIYQVQLPDLDRDGADVQVFLKVNGTWQVDTLSLNNVPHAEVCRDDPGQGIDEFVLMFSNSQIDKAKPLYAKLAPKDKPVSLLASNIGCRDWTLNADITATGPSVSEHLVVNNMVLSNQSSSPLPQPGPAQPNYPYEAGPQGVVPQLIGYQYVISGGSANWTYTPGSDCDLANSSQFALGPTMSGNIIANFAFGNALIERGLRFSGLYNSSTMPTMTLPRSGACTGPATVVTPGINILTEYGASNSYVDASGLKISADYGTGPSSGLTGSWTLTGVTH